jgi:hypothetical protein
MTWDRRRVPDRRHQRRGDVVTIIRGADHFSNFAPEVVADIIGEWILAKEGEW